MTETRDVPAIQRHTLRVLTAGQVVGSAALSAAVTVGAFVIQDILGQETALGGMATATVTVGTGASWAAGDWNRDGAFNSADLVFAMQSGYGEGQ